jgi:hypothetical protein
VSEGKIIESRKTLDKLEHKINLGIKSISNGIGNIIEALNEIEKHKLYLLTGSKTIRDYILKQEYPMKLNLHISSIFLKLQIMKYAEGYQIDYGTVQDIGEGKFKLLVQKKAELGKDITLEELKKKRTIEIEHQLSGGREVSEKTTPEEVEFISQAFKVFMADVKKFVVNDRKDVVTIQLLKGSLSKKYFNELKDFPRVSFE